MRGPCYAQDPRAASSGRGADDGAGCARTREWTAMSVAPSPAPETPRGDERAADAAGWAAAAPLPVRAPRQRVAHLRVAGRPQLPLVLHLHTGAVRGHPDADAGDGLHRLRADRVARAPRARRARQRDPLACLLALRRHAGGPPPGAARAAGGAGLPGAARGAGGSAAVHGSAALRAPDRGRLLPGRGHGADDAGAAGDDPGDRGRGAADERHLAQRRRDDHDAADRTCDRRRAARDREQRLALRRGHALLRRRHRRACADAPRDRPWRGRRARGRRPGLA